MTKIPATSKRKITKKTSSAASEFATESPILAKPAKRSKKINGKAENKVKVIRDSFTMPQNDYERIGELKQVLLKAGLHVKKSELLRAGLQALCKLSTPQLKQAMAKMEQIKTGRPKKGA